MSIHPQPSLTLTFFLLFITERISIGGPVESLIPKFQWVDIDEWNFGSDTSKKTQLREMFPAERTYSMMNSQRDSIPETSTANMTTESAQTLQKAFRSPPLSPQDTVVKPSQKSSPKAPRKCSLKTAPKESPELKKSSESSDVPNVVEKEF